MNRMVPAAFLLLAGCAATPPVVGNAKGGIIDVGLHYPPDVLMKVADTHCAAYGKRARITTVRAPAVTEVLFECT